METVMSGWVRVDTKFTSHPKVLEVGPLGEALWIRGLCYAGDQLTDGFIPTNYIKRMGDMKGIAVASRLVAVGLWEEVDGGYRIHDYLEWQQSRDDIDDIRAKRAEAGRRGGKQNRNKTEAKPKQVATGLSKQNRSKTEAEEEIEIERELPPLPPKGESPPNPRTTSMPYLLFEAMCESVGTDPSEIPKRDKDKQLAIAKRMADDGTTPQDIRLMVGWLLPQPWVNGSVDMNLLEKQRSKWILGGRLSAPPGPRPSKNGRTGYTPDELLRLANGEDIHDQTGNGQDFVAPQFRVVR